jgi:hypothetical protein
MFAEIKPKRAWSSNRYKTRLEAQAIADTFRERLKASAQGS